jgi:hypothetical protein
LQEDSRQGEKGAGWKMLFWFLEAVSTAWREAIKPEYFTFYDFAA